MSDPLTLATAYFGHLSQSLMDKLHDNPLQPVIVQISTETTPNQVAKPDLEDEQKRWLLVGICLHTVISPALRQYIPPEVNKIYNSLVNKHQIDKQGFRNFMKRYQPTNKELNYEAINNNAAVPKVKGKKDIASYDYTVKSDVDFTKLFMQTNMAHYTGFDDTCDSSALLGMIINIDFPSRIQKVAEQVRSDVRNPWAHCTLPEWDAIKYQDSFQLMNQLIKILKLPTAIEQTYIGELIRWQTNGIQFLQGTTLGLELVRELKTETAKLSKYLLDVVYHTNECITDSNEALTYIKDCLQTTIDRVNVLEIQSITLKENSDDLETKTHQITLMQSVISNSIEEINTDLKNLQDDIRPIKEQQNVDQQSITEMKTDIVHLKSDLAERICDTDQAKSDMHDIKISSEQTKTEIQELKTDFLKNQADINSTKEEVDKIKTGFENLVQNSSESKTNVKLFFNVPDKIPVFIARNEELKQIQSGFNTKCDDQHIQVICGLGGIGKTTLAIEYSWTFQSFYPAGVFWMSAESNDSLQDSIQRLANDREIVGNDFKETLHKVLKYIPQLQGRWLLVIDNVDIDELHGSIKELILGSWKRFSNGHIIITSRRETTEAEADFRVKIEDCITLDVLTVFESKQFMINRSCRQSDDDDESSLNKLVIELGGLPLALEQASAHIKALKCSYKEYLQKFLKKRLSFLRASKYPADVAKERRAVITTWHLNFELIEKQSKEEGLGTAAVTAMEIAAHLHADDIPLCVFNVGSPEVCDDDLLDVLHDDVGAKQISEILSRFSLFQGRDIHTLSVHRLVQEVVRENITNLDRKQFIIQCSTRMVNRALDSTISPTEVININNRDTVSLQLWSILTLNANTVRSFLLDFAQTNPERKSICFNVETTKLLHACSIYHSLNQRQDDALACQDQMLNILPAIDISETILRNLTSIKIPLLNNERLIIQNSLTAVVRPAALSNESSEALLLNTEPERLREKGNQAFKCKKYYIAIQCYSEALKVSKEADPRLFHNRSLAYFKVCDYEKALLDADKCMDAHQLQKAKSGDGIRFKIHKACFRKAFAIGKLVGLGVLPKYYESVGLAAAAVAGHLNHQYLVDYRFKIEYPVLLFKIIENENELGKTISSLINRVNTTLLLRKGRYKISGKQGEITVKSIQIIGIEEGVEIISPDPIPLIKPDSSWFRVKFDVEPQINVHFENVCFPSETGQICVGENVNAIFYRCRFSNGQKSCENFPACKGGPGCVNPDRSACSVMFTKIERSAELRSCCGVVGYPGISKIDTGRVIVDHCNLDRCGGGGTLCRGVGAHFEVKNSAIRNMRQMGVEARDGGNVVVENCSIINNQFHGVAIGPNGNGHVRNCIIQGNGQEGIWCGGIMEEVNECGHTTATTNPAGGSRCIINGNLICQNGMSGLSFDGGSYEVSNNKIFDNWLWGVMVKSRSVAIVNNNEIFGNKCGGIRIGINYSAPVLLDGNTIRDHVGPPIYISGSTFSVDIDIPVNSSLPEDYKHIGMIEGEVDYYTIPPLITSRNIFRDNEKGQLHPMKYLSLIQTCCFCHSSSNMLKMCGKCKKANYCSKKCQAEHWSRHKNLCRLLRASYTVEIKMKSTETAKQFLGLDENCLLIRNTNAPLPELGKGNPPDKLSDRKFIVKIQSGKELTGYEPDKYLKLYDQTQTLNIWFRNPSLYHLVCECGVLAASMFSTKKIYCWASFKNRGNILCIHTDNLPPFQKDW